MSIPPILHYQVALRQHEELLAETKRERRNRAVRELTNVDQRASQTAAHCAAPSRYSILVGLLVLGRRLRS